MTDLRAALDAAHTPLPWHLVYHESGSTRYIEADIGGGWLQEVAACGVTEAPEQTGHNAALIVAAVNAAPELLAENERLDAGWHAANIAALETANERGRLLAELEAVRAFAQSIVDDYKSEDGMYSWKHYAKAAQEALDAARGRA